MARAKSIFSRVLKHLAACVVFLGIGLLAKAGLEALRKEPAQLAPSEPRLEVNVIEATPEDVPVLIRGYGDVRAVDVLHLTPKVAGEVIEIHPRLDMGEVIPEGELLFRIDPTDYELAKAQADAQVQRLETTIALLKEQYATDKGRVNTYRRTMELAQKEFERDQKLYQDDQIGSDSMLSLAEINYNKARDAFDQVHQAIELYPMRIREAESGLAAAQAQKRLAEVSIERTEIRAPFNARIKLVQVVLGQNVAPGAPVAVLANDAALEISVSLDSRDAAAWLLFEDGAAECPEALDNATAWFENLKPVSCRITWTDAAHKHHWVGTLARVERFDQMTRTVSVAVRVQGENARSPEGGLPLVEGMFCEVAIPGQTMEGVFRLPRWAVTFEDEAFVAVDDDQGRPRLEKRSVVVARRQGEEVFVSDGLRPGDHVLVTRLANPVPGLLLECSRIAPDAASLERLEPNESDDAGEGGEPA
ncbi:MAG TPA: HlyD family efflux transporter periplasmic adaptor subunit [Candidatus Hydrogenedentes bacterium]|nr:HlyD family efflux transporter periplasmic adaptor subunit [Candidatus Hydrogenedentota bacterium]